MVRARLSLAGLLLAACSPRGPQLSERPMPAELTVTQSVYAAVQAYFARPEDATAEVFQVVFIGVDPSDLPPEAQVTSDTRCPRPLSAGYMISPDHLRLTADSLGASLRVMVCGTGRGGAVGELEMRRRPGRMWTVWRWEVLEVG
jgi:hypothetical protein